MTLFDFCAGASVIGLFALAVWLIIAIIRAPYDPDDDWWNE
jgi:hypothetical protein